MTQHIQKRKSVDFQGAIEVVPIEGVFQLLYYANLSGKLILLRPPLKASFYFSNGKLVWGSLHSRQKQLGRMLLDSAAITEPQLEKCLNLHAEAKGKKKLGELLLEQGFLKTDILHQSLRQQAKDAFFKALQWQHGSFAFISDQTLPADNFSLNERIDHLLLEGAVQIDCSRELDA